MRYIHTRYTNMKENNQNYTCWLNLAKPSKVNNKNPEGSKADFAFWKELAWTYRFMSSHRWNHFQQATHLSVKWLQHRTESRCISLRNENYSCVQEKCWSSNVGVLNNRRATYLKLQHVTTLIYLITWWMLQMTK